jgi:hypothetical protein
MPVIPAAMMASRFAPALWSMGGRAATGLRNLLTRGDKVYAGPTSKTGQWINRHPYLTAAGTGAGGLLAYEMGQSKEGENVVTGGEGPGTGFQVRDRSTIPDDWQSALGDTLAAKEKQSALNLKRLKQVIMRGAILKAHNPHAKDNYVKNALDVLKAEALQRNDMKQARIIDNIKNKDGSVPDDAKLIYDRIIKSGGSPQFAAEISGHQLKIEKTQAEAASDYMRNQPKLSDLWSKGALMLTQIKAQYDSGDTQNAINKLAMLLKTEDIGLSERYGTLQAKSDEEMHELASQILQGKTDVEIPTEDDIKIEER